MPGKGSGASALENVIPGRRTQSRYYPSHCVFLFLLMQDQQTNVYPNEIYKVDIQFTPIGSCRDISNREVTLVPASSNFATTEVQVCVSDVL